MTRPTALTKTRVRAAVVAACGGCAIQHTGWPCGTCFFSAPLPIPDTDRQTYWHAVCAFRGDYAATRNATGERGYQLARDIVFDEQGRFLRHDFVWVSRTEVEARIARLMAALEGDAR